MFNQVLFKKGVIILADESVHSESEFLNKDIDYKIVHYIENRAKHGDTYSDIKKDLVKGGNDLQKISKLFQYVSDHRVEIQHHKRNMRIFLILIGIIIFLLVTISAAYFINKSFNLV
jgi:hypothetical protein